MVLVDYLRKNWFDLLRELSLEKHQLGDEIFTDLIDVYSHPDRHYHNLKHIKNVLLLLQEVKYLSQNYYALVLSAWFHDYIYNPQARDNEQLSAIYAEQVLSKLSIDSKTTYLTTEIIRSTQKHQPLIENIDNLIFLDADLAILGTTTKKYFQYTQAIRQEYKYLSDRNYRQGRTKVLTQFLIRPKIYYTDYFYRHLEANARKNLQAEIKLLNNDN